MKKKPRIRSVLIIISIIIMLPLSTYGWRFSRVSYSTHTDEDEQIAHNLERHVLMLSHEIGWRTVEDYENLKKAAQYIIDHFKQAGFETDVQVFTTDASKVGNIIAEKKGFKNPKKITIIGANYDTYSNPGADTNASGIAVLLELSSMLSGQKTEETIRLVAFVNKEPPYLKTNNMGSLRYVNRLKKDRDRIKGAIILDSVGYFTHKNYSQRYPPLLGILSSDKGHFIALVSNLGSLKFSDTIKQTLREKVSFPVSFILGYDFIDSDHWSFWEKKYPAVLLTDTGSYRNPHYHNLLDTYEKLNYINMAQLTRGINAVIFRLVNPSIEGE